MLLALNPDLVLSHQNRELLAVHQSNRRRIGACRFLSSATAEVAGRNNEPLLVRPEAAPNLLNDRRRHVALPALCLDRHANTNDIADNQRTAYVNASIASESGHFDVSKAHLHKQRCDKLLEIGR